MSKPERCPVCLDGPMVEVMPIDGECPAEPDGCTPFGCSLCAPMLPVPCPACGLFRCDPEMLRAEA